MSHVPSSMSPCRMCRRGPSLLRFSFCGPTRGSSLSSRSSSSAHGARTTGADMPCGLRRGPRHQSAFEHEHHTDRAEAKQAEAAGRVHSALQRAVQAYPPLPKPPTHSAFRADAHALSRDATPLQQRVVQSIAPADFPCRLMRAPFRIPRPSACSTPCTAHHPPHALSHRLSR